MKVKCAVINDLLPLYVDDVLSKESRELVEEHIKECESCRKMLENMKGKMNIPVNKELRMDETKSLKGLKKIVTRYKWLTVVFAAVALIAIMFLAVYIMNHTTADVPYDGSSITLEEREDGYYIHYHDRGAIMFSAGGNDGEWEIEFSQTFWDKYIWPQYHKGDDVKFLCGRGEMTKLTAKDGTVIWEANEEQLKEYEEHLKAEKEELEQLLS